jgi:hypothetical protein
MYMTRQEARDDFQQHINPVPENRAGDIPRHPLDHDPVKSGDTPLDVISYPVSANH